MHIFHIVACRSVSRTEVEAMGEMHKETMEFAEERLALVNCRKGLNLGSWRIGQVHETVEELQQLVEEAFGGEWPLIVKREGEEKLK